MDPSDHAALDALDADTRDSIAQTLWLPEFRPDLIPADLLGRLTSPKNSNALFGQRMRARIQELLDRHESFGRDTRACYALLLRHCDALSPKQAYALATLLGGDSARGYKEIPDRAAFRWPADYAADLATQVGWYFLIGSARGRNGREYGVEVMLFRYALLPSPLAHRFGLSDEENQLVELHFAIAEADRGHWQSTPFVVAGTTGLLEFKRDTIHMRLGRNVIGPADGAGPFPMRVQMRGVDRGGARPVVIEADLTFLSGKGLMPLGTDGCMPCCGGLGTLYYAIPDLEVDLAASTLTLDGERIELEWGRFWIEHQWATGMIPNGTSRNPLLRAAGSVSPPQPGGWDYFIAQFDAGYQLNLYSLHTRDYLPFYFQTGPTPPGTMAVAIDGTVMDPQKGVSDVSGMLMVTEWVKVESSPEPSRYYPTRAWYPNRWEFELGAPLPDDIRRFTMFPIVPKGGSTGFFATGAQYQEGAVYLRDPQGRDIGRGWAESVLYADQQQNKLDIAGLPSTAETLKALEIPPVSTTRKLWTLLYLAWPPHARELKRLLQLCVEAGLERGYPPKARAKASPGAQKRV